MVTIEQIIRELLNPVFTLVGGILRPFGSLALGVVAGTLLRQAAVYKQHSLHVPLMFLGVVILFGLLAFGPWSSAGTLAGAGIGLFVGYMLLGRKENVVVVEEEETEPQP